jgi:hypothetical protein
MRSLMHKTAKDWPQCLKFQCTRDQSKCDNALATNFDGPDPPCCVHVLRDMARQFDRVMCFLGLEYLPHAKMLLGLARSDRLIPWTSDNDHFVERATMIAMISLWHTTSHLERGMSLVFGKGLQRMCINSSFANGRLLRWKVNGTVTNPEELVNGTKGSSFFDTNVYTDFYAPFGGPCWFPKGSLRPLTRRSFYNGTLKQHFPNKPEIILANLHGPDW